MAQVELLAPIPGTFYRKPSPDAALFVEDGADVAIGDQIGLIEVMKTFIPVHAEVAGKGIAFSVEDAEPVMAGQVLAGVSA